MLNKRFQGLPISFIVILVLALIVLVAIAIIFIQSSSQTNIFDKQNVINICNSACFLENQFSSEKPKVGYSRTSDFCSKKYDIKGVDAPKSCNELVSCEIVFKDGSTCNTKCENNQLKCK